MQETQAIISLKAVEENAAAIARAVKKPLVAVVKDDAYGHGAERVALALEGKVAGFAVATVAEGASLRIAGVSSPVLVLTPCLCGEEVARAAAYGLTVSLSSLSALRIVAAAREKPQAHLSVNTGMNRYGVRCGRVAEACREAKRAGIAVTGVYSHLYDAADPAARAIQTQLFSEAAEKARAYFPHCVRHLSATGGALAGDCFDLVRIGIALYGYLPQGIEGVKLRPAMKLYATVSHRCKQTGEGAGYGRYAGAGKLFTVRAGYGDGLFRAGGGGALGKLCMDAAIFRGERKFGSRMRIARDVPAYAAEHGTTEYEALVCLTKRAVKEYV